MIAFRHILHNEVPTAHHMNHPYYTLRHPFVSHPKKMWKIILAFAIITISNLVYIHVRTVYEAESIMIQYPESTGNSKLSS